MSASFKTKALNFGYLEVTVGLRRLFVIFLQICQDIKDHPWERTANESESVEKDDRICKLHCLKIRLMRHKELAPQRYLAIDACLRADPRLANTFA